MTTRSAAAHTVSEQSHQFERALAENRQRDAIVAGRRVLVACTDVLRETHEQRDRRSKSWSNWVGGVAHEHDAHTTRHYEVIADETSRRLHAIDPAIVAQIDRGYELRPPSAAGIEQPCATRPASSTPNISLALEQQATIVANDMTAAFLTTATPAIVGVAARKRELQTVTRHLEDTVELIGAVATLVERAEPNIDRLVDELGTTNFDVERATRNVQRHHDRHVTVLQSQRPLGVVCGQCGVPIDVELRALVGIAVTAVLYAMYHGTMAYGE